MCASRPFPARARACFPAARPDPVRRPWERSTRSRARDWPAGAAARPLPQEDRLVTQSHLMIANPFRGQGLASMFATHPPMPERIARLEQMARDLGQP